MNVLQPLSYYGGKNPKRSLTRWINSLLPEPSKESSYIEPFCGMMGVLLSRHPSGTEIVNDVNKDIVGWWTAVRDHTDELARMIQYSPYSRTLFEECLDLLASDESDLLRRAWAQHVILWQNVLSIPVATKTRWSVTFQARPGINMRHSHKQFQLLAERICNVQLENKDALDIIERTMDLPYVVLYCDPPYEGAAIDGYGTWELDRERMAELLREHKGQVAVSGYGDNWDDLGFHRHEFKLKTTVGPQACGRTGSDRVEVLWVNYVKETSLFA